MLRLFARKSLARRLTHSVRHAPPAAMFGTLGVAAAGALATYLLRRRSAQRA
jgi:hypothetical protein